MSRTFRTIRRTMMASIAVLAISSSIAQGGSILELIGGDPFTFYDPSGGQPVAVEHTESSIHRAEWPSGGVSLVVHSTTGIVNPGPDGSGTTSFFDVFYDGPANNFPTDSFFDTFVTITDPGQNLGRATVKQINNPNIAVQFPGGSEVLNSLVPQVNPAQVGLSLSGLQVVQGTSPDPNANSFFDIFMDLHFDGSGTINPNLPLFEITTTATTPEPSTIVLAAMGVAAFVVVARKKRLHTL